MYKSTQHPHAASSSSVIRTLVADDHAVVRRGIVNELTRHGDIEVLGEASNGHDVLRQVQSLTLDVLLLDINMPGTPTLDVIRQIATLPARPHVIVLTAHNDSEHILMMLKAGVKGYILKDENPENIAVAMRTVMQGDTWLSAAVLTRVINHSVNEPAASSLPQLSDREVEVLEQLVLGKDNQEIGDVLRISERTVRFHLHNIYDKLGVRRRGEAIAWGIRERLGQPVGHSAHFAA